MIYDAKYRAKPKQAYLPCATNVDHEQRVQQLHSTLPPLGLQSEVITVIVDRKSNDMNLGQYQSLQIWDTSNFLLNTYLKHQEKDREQSLPTNYYAD